MDGVLLVDKPRGITSFSLVRGIRKVANVKRVGHAGTLDPDATGLLLVCIGKATKLSDVLMSGDKTYQSQMIFGKVSDTFDDTGEITECSEHRVSRVELAEALPSFTGKILQKPPIFSAKKIAGKKLYEYARKGQSVEIPEKEVRIDSIEILDFQADQALIEVSCSKGTYIRSLIHDLGQKLKIGAIAKGIRRISSGNFDVSQAMVFGQELERQDIERALIPLSTLRRELFPQGSTIPPQLLRRVF
ncbi:MAG: tRNA pseudouridine(55) synthase TruB [Bdellovibrionales bacterium]|nr:tRNA pseudouridine(55) synthase TruB [Bdellovibrionales bacterium]